MTLGELFDKHVPESAIREYLAALLRDAANGLTDTGRASVASGATGGTVCLCGAPVPPSKGYKPRLYCSGTCKNREADRRRKERARNRAHGRAFRRAGNRPPTPAQVAAAAREVARMKREVLRPFGAAPVDGAAGE